MRERKLKVMNELIDKLSDEDSEANLNACTILKDLLETKEYFNVMQKKATLSKLHDIAYNDNGTTISRCCTLVVLHSFVEKFRSGKDDNDSEKGADDDDDNIIIKNNDDSDEEKTNSGADAAVIDCLVTHIDPIKNSLVMQPEDMCTSFGETFRPLGMLRLRLIELLTQIVKVNQT